MKVIHVSYSDHVGGASIAAFRLHNSLKKKLSTRMLVNKADTGNITVMSPNDLGINFKKKIFSYLSVALVEIIKINKSIKNSHLSLSIFGSGLVDKLNNSDADIIHLHWLQREMMSIEDIGRIKKPIVWTLHDMWAFSGVEHYPINQRWMEGYYDHNKSKNEKGIDIDKWIWAKKNKNWKRKINIICPSNWLADCARKSKLMKNWPVTVFPNPINIDFWKPIDKKLARKKLNLPLDKKLILFSSFGGIKDYRKGFDLFLKSLRVLNDKNKINDLNIILLGQEESLEKYKLKFKFHNLGNIKNENHLKLVYNASDLLALPSRQDNLPNTAVEAHSTGTPVISFKIGGIPDIVDHKVTGYLAKPFDTEDMARGIEWIFDNEKFYKLGESARKKIKENFSDQIISDKLEKFYYKILNN